MGKPVLITVHNRTDAKIVIATRILDKKRTMAIPFQTYSQLEDALSAERNNLIRIDTEITPEIENELKGDSASNILRLVVLAHGFGSGDKEYSLEKKYEGLSIVNDGKDDLVFTVNDISVIVKEKEVFSDEFESFDELSIKSEGPWRLALKGVK